MTSLISNITFGKLLTKIVLATLLFLTSEAIAGFGSLESKDGFQNSDIEGAHKKIIADRVIDGDTFTSGELRIRLWGVDAPERGEAFYEDSKALLTLLVHGHLECKFIEKDKYHRSVMHCLSDKKDVGAIMIGTGMAKDFKRYSSGFYQSDEAMAKRAKIGIWE